MIFKKDELRLLWPFYFSRILGLSLTPAYFTLFFLDKNISIFQVSIIVAVCYFASILSDIPTGAVADLYGRKFSVILGLVLLGLIDLLIPLYSNFYYFVFLTFLMGISSTFISGSSDAWVISILNKHKARHLTEEYYSKEMIASSFCILLGPLLAILLIKKFSMNSLWYAQGILLLISALFLLIPDEYFIKKKFVLKNIIRKTFAQSSKAVKFSFIHPIILRLLLSSFFIFFVLAGINLLYTPYFKEFNIPISYFGYILAIAGLFGLVTPLLAMRFAKLFKNKTKYFAIIVFFSFLLIFSIFFSNNLSISIILLLSFWLILDFIMPIERAYFQRFVPNKMRATISSFKTTVISVSAALASIFIGFSVSLFGSKFSFILLSLFLIPSLFLYLSISKHKH